VRQRSSGKQHRLDLKLSDTFTDGALDFYSDQFTLHLELKRNKISGTAIVSGKNHSLKVGMKPSNRWEMAYSHERQDQEMSLFAEYGRVKKEENLFGIAHKSKKHDIKLAYKENLGIHGHIKEKTRYLDYNLRFTQKHTSSLEVSHSGKQHSIKLKFFTDGSFEVRAKVKVHGGEVTVSKRKNRLEAEVSIPL
jgi:hypothetical protein